MKSNLVPRPFTHFSMLHAKKIEKWVKGLRTRLDEISCTIHTLAPVLQALQCQVLSCHMIMFSASPYLCLCSLSLFLATKIDLHQPGEWDIPELPPK